jgi:mono/diheme cytochrome c family protein
MRVFGILFAAGLLSACDQRAEQAAPPIVTPAAAFDGGNYGDAGAKLAHGARLAKVLGCVGCHGSNYQGGEFPPEPGWGSIHSANLTREQANWSDAELEEIMRTGVRPDGRELWLMPAQTYQHLSSSDMAAILAFLRSLKPVGESHPAPVFGPGARAEIAAGDLRPPSKLVPDARKRTPSDLGPRHALGRYIATVTCAGCHGFELEGMDGWSPDLVVAATYSPAEFTTLLTTGRPSGPRKLTDMADFARKSAAHMTANERAAVYRYLKARAERPQ